MPDANAEPKPHPSPANVEVAGGRPRGGAGLFSLYRTLGSPAAETSAVPAPNKGSATVVTDSSGSAVGTSRAARLLAAKTAAAATAPTVPAAPAIEKKNDPKSAATVSEEGASVRAVAPMLEKLPETPKPVTSADDDSAAVSAEELIDGPETKALGTPSFPNRDGGPGRSPEALTKALEDAFTELKPLGDAKPESPRQARRSRRGGSARGIAHGYENVDKRLIEARQKKQLKRRVRGEDYEQVTVIMDRELYLAFDECLRDLSEKAGGHVKLSRSIFVRALLKRFLADASTRYKGLDFGGLFTPDPRSAEELAVIEAALMERLAE